VLQFADGCGDYEVLGPVTCAKYRDYAAHIRVSGGNLLTIIDDILEMAHIEAGRVKIERSSSPIGDLLEAPEATPAPEDPAARPAAPVAPPAASPPQPSAAPRA
jgi:signal transduction histidine kinase